MAKTYDLVVIGSGTAAQVAGTRVRTAGWTVAVADHRPFGGTCALRGCDPKKMLISAAEAIDAANRLREHGVAGELRVDWRELMAFKHTFTDPIPTRQEQRYVDKGIDTFHGYGESCCDSFLWNSSFTTRLRVPGGNTCSVLRNSITQSFS